MVYFRNVEYVDDIEHIISDHARIDEMRNNIQQGDVYIARKVVSEELIIKFKAYLARVGGSTIPNYHKIEAGAPNFHRMNRLDPRAYVKGCFHQFVFFPWNQDYFNLFEVCRAAYQLKNLTSGLPKDSFLGAEPEDGCTARLAVQFYPKGMGLLNKHQDPVDYHQLTVPIVIMSKKGVDFEEGGAYVEKENGERTILEDICELGDIVYFNAQMPHGVQQIDPGSNVDWIEFQGRWMLLLAVNKLVSNASIHNSVDLEAVAK